MLKTSLVGAIACFALGAPCYAQASDSAAALGAAETVLRALSTRDTTLMRSVLLPGATFVATVTLPNGETRARASTDRQVYSSLVMEQTPMLERMWSPVVAVHGTVATITAPYDFHRNGTFSHCGVDVFMLARSGAEWRVVNITYTVQQVGCAPSPLGPPTR
jgi:hypothetical protein